MSLPPWREEPVGRSHDRAAFDCGEPALNDFLRRFARQSHESNAAKTFCAVDERDPTRVMGFYTIAPSAVLHDAVPSHLTKRLAKHEVSGFKLARLATDMRFAGRGLGGQLLAAAALRCLRVAEQSGGVLLILDAKSERAAGWYMGYGALPLLDRPMTLVMPLASFAGDLRAHGLL